MRGLVLLCLLALAGCAVTAPGVSVTSAPSPSATVAERAAKVTATHTSSGSPGVQPREATPSAGPSPSPTPSLALPFATYLGDSITASVWPVDQRYQTQVTTAEHLQGSDVVATIGWTTENALTTYAASPHSVMGDQLVVVELGTNDVLGAEDFTQWSGEYHSLMLTVRQRNPWSRLICLSPWHTNDAHEQAYSWVIAQECAHMSGRYVPLEWIYDTPGTQTSSTNLQ